MSYKTSIPKQERRRYVRLGTVFPVQFCLLSLDGKQVLSEWQQGFTRDIGKGGIGLTVNNLNPDLAGRIKNKEVKVSLDMEMPIIKSPLITRAGVIWVQAAPDEANKYLIGLAYEDIDRRQNNRIMRYVITKKYLPPAIVTTVVVLSLVLLVNGYLTRKLIRGNKLLVEQLVSVIQESSLAKQNIKEIGKEKEELQAKIQDLQSRIQALDQAKSQQDQAQVQEIVQLNTQIEQLAQEKKSLQEQLTTIQQQEASVNEMLQRLDKKKAHLEKANLDRMYQWLTVHQNPRTGLVLSFEGDSEIAEWGFTYDQALAAQVYTYSADYSRAKKILDFFAKSAKRIDGRFVNAYYVNDGSPAEYAVQSGPNIWLGIAILQYTKKSQDDAYLELAEEIAQSTIYLQNQDKDGGIIGGPNVNWYSTEHNLDAYAFFNMLYKITGKYQYKESSDKVLNWLRMHTYDKAEAPIKRGKGDSTIATDTYAWSIAAIGPEKLKELGMDPDQIMEYAEQNCGVEVSYLRPEGKTIKIKGFDFAPKRHLARAGVVSSEWTAQMVLAFKIMADFYYKENMPVKARAYDLKADTYLAELANMVISSPSPSGQGESCLPYATQESVDTGHGWATPKGVNTGSVAGTVYTLFAYYKYNPLELKD